VAGRPEHHPVAGGLTEAGMGCLVVLADVGLDLDDPSHPTAGGVVADQPRADEGACGLERRLREDGPVEDAQLNV
jgi:hypothetical protein